MKQISLFVVALVFIAFSIQAQTIYPSGVPGCIARWTFDTTDVVWLDTLPDMSANNNHGSVTNIASVPGFRNKPHAAGNFDGNTSFATVLHNSMLSPSSLSIITLLKFNEFYSGNCQGNNIVYKGFDYSGNCDWAFYVADGDLCSQFTPTTEKPHFQTSNIPPTSTIPTGNFIDTNKWYFIATTYNGSTINYYQIIMDTTNKANNILPNYTFNYPSTIGTTTNNLFIGATQNPPFKYYLNGAMDELILFNKYLSNTEIQSIYDYLYGWVTGIENNDVKGNLVSITSLNQTISVISNSHPIKSVELINLAGQVIGKNNSNFNDIKIGNYSGILIVRVKLINGDVYNQKTFIR